MNGQHRRDSTTLRLAALAGVVYAVALVRLVPRPWNLAPLGALALFGGAHIRKRGWALLVPVTAAVFSDVLLYATLYRSYFRDSFAMVVTTELFVYGAYALMACVGRWLRGRRRVHNIALATVCGSGIFFLVSNLGSWLSTGVYPLTPLGLAECYAAALPFFRNTLASDAVFVTVLFGGFALAERHLPILREQPAPEPGQARTTV